MIFESTCRGIPTITKLKMQKMESASHGVKMNMKTLPLTYALPMPLRSFDAAESFKEYDIKVSDSLTGAGAKLQLAATLVSSIPLVNKEDRSKRKRNRTESDGRSVRMKPPHRLKPPRTYD